MDLNATLLVQMLVFIIFVVLTMRLIWKPLTKVLADRREKIADGLAAAEQGQKDLELAQHKSREIITDAKTQAAHIIEQANQRSNHIIEEAKTRAREEGDRLVQLAQGEIEQEYNAAREELVKQLAQIAVTGAEKILQKEVDKASNDRLINQLVRDF